MSGFEDTQALNDTIEQAWGDQREMRRLGQELAQASADARGAKAAEMLRLTSSGTSATLAKEAVYASQAVNDAKLRAETLQALYDATREALMLRKREADILRERIARDWQSAGRMA